VSPGAFVRAGEKIAEVAQITDLDVDFAVPERYLAHLRRGTEVDVSTTAFPGYELKGRIDVIDPVLDPATRSVHVIARLANPEARFRPGMSASVRAVLSSREHALTIPSEAVFAEGDQFLAYVVQSDGTVQRATLSLGTRLAGSVEVIDGLKEGDVVVRAGHQKLFPGAKVMAVNSREEEGTPAPAASADTTGAATEAGPADTTAAPAASTETAAAGSTATAESGS